MNSSKKLSYISMKSKLNLKSFFDRKKYFLEFSNFANVNSSNIQRRDSFPVSKNLE